MSETINQIHPINAEYLLEKEPHHVYVDEWGNILELTVRRFSDLVVEKLYEHGGVMAVGYYDATTEGKINFQDTFILRRDGDIIPIDIRKNYHERIWLDQDILYMLLNPLEINGWIPEKRKECHEELRKQGKMLDIPRIFHTTKRQYLHFLAKENR